MQRTIGIVLEVRRPSGSTPGRTLFPYTTLFRSAKGNATKITCTVTDKDGTKVKTFDTYQYNTDEKDADGNPIKIETLKNNQFQFLASKDGTYTVSYSATLNEASTSATFEIKAGDVVPPEFTADIGYISNVLYTADSTPSASTGREFDFATIVLGSEEGSGLNYEYSKQLINPEGDVVDTVTSQNRLNNGSSYALSMAGTYTVVYTVTDTAGNVNTQRYSITVTSSSGSISTGSITVLSVVIIVVVVILIAGVIIYLIRFRKRKTV